MKQFTIKVSHASPAQLLTIAAELKIMSNNWTKFGPRILINSQKLEAPRLRLEKTSKQELTSKQQAASVIQGTHSKGRILNVKERS